MLKKELWLYSLGSTSINLLTLFFTQKLFFFYDPKDYTGAIIPLAIIVVVLVISRFSDAITDPIISVLNETLPLFKKIGISRGPILVALPFLIFSFYFLWHPHLLFTEETSLWIKSFWVFLIINVYFIAFTFITTAYDSYLAKIAQSSSERLTISQYKTLFGGIGVIISLPFIAYRDISLASNGILIISVVCFIFCCFGITKDKIIDSEKQVNRINLFSYKNNFFINVIQFFKGRKYFLYFLLIVILTDAAINLFLKNLDYYVANILAPETNSTTDFIAIRERLKFLLFGCFSISLMASLPLWKWLANKHSMIKVTRIGLLVLIFLFPPLFFFNNHLLSYFLITLIFSLIGFFYAAFTLTEFAFIGEFEKKETQTGLLFGLSIFAKKIGLIMGLFLFSFVVEIFSFFDLTIWSFRSVSLMISLLIFLAYFCFCRFAKMYSNS